MKLLLIASMFVLTAIAVYICCTSPFFMPITYPVGVSWGTHGTLAGQFDLVEHIPPSPVKRVLVPGIDAYAIQDNRYIFGRRRSDQSVWKLDQSGPQSVAVPIQTNTASLQWQQLSRINNPPFLLRALTYLTVLLFGWMFVIGAVHVMGERRKARFGEAKE